MIFFSDPNIRVACLTCLGAVLSVPASEVEISHILNSLRPSNRNSLSSSLDLSSSNPQRRAFYSSTSSNISDIPTPHLSSGAQTPQLTLMSVSMQQNDDNSPAGSHPWIITLCVNNVQVQSSGTTQPLPVRLESLQLLAQLCKHHFTYIRWVFQDIL